MPDNSEAIITQADEQSGLSPETLARIEARRRDEQDSGVAARYLAEYHNLTATPLTHDDLTRVHNALMAQAGQVEWQQSSIAERVRIIRQTALMHGRAIPEHLYLGYDERDEYHRLVYQLPTLATEEAARVETEMDEHGIAREVFRPTVRMFHGLQVHFVDEQTHFGVGVGY